MEDPHSTKQPGSFAALPKTGARIGDVVMVWWEMEIKQQQQQQAASSSSSECRAKPVGRHISYLCLSSSAGDKRNELRKVGCKSVGWTSSLWVLGPELVKCNKLNDHLDTVQVTTME
uniref:Uncharacterized protein n=1 Tax=Anopheles farauti TaxID=69004 RepID=A0A182Q0Y2_9DIPT